MSRKIGQSLTKAEKIELNDYGDFIMIDPSDSTLMQRYSELMEWMDSQEKVLDEKAKAAEKLFEGKGNMLEEDEDGLLIVNDPEQFAYFNNIRTTFYHDAAEKIDECFGAGTLKKYYRDSYEINPDYVPDEMAILTFIEEIAIHIKDIFKSRNQKLSGKYGVNRAGAK